MFFFVKKIANILTKITMCDRKVSRSTFKDSQKKKRFPRRKFLLQQSFIKFPQSLKYEA